MIVVVVVVVAALFSSLVLDLLGDWPLTPSPLFVRSLPPSQDHISDEASFGETLFTAFKTQFELLRDGDRFFYLNDPELIQVLDILGLTLADFENIKLSNIILMNTEVEEIQDNVFIADTTLSDPCMSPPPPVESPPPESVIASEMPPPPLSPPPSESSPAVEETDGSATAQGWVSGVRANERTNERTNERSIDRLPD